MKKFVLRHWRGNGQVIPDIMKEHYYDYPKHRNIRPYKLSECICQVISEKEYLKFILDRYGLKEHNKAVLKHKLGSWNLITDTTIIDKVAGC